MIEDIQCARHHRWLAALLLVAAVTLAFANSTNGRFFLDDSKVITDNARIRHVMPRTPLEWVGPRALVDFTFAVNYAAGGLEPAGYHAVNMILHAISALLLFGLLRRTLALPVLPDRVRGSCLPLATGAALVWAVHPLAGSAVLYLCQRYELMASLFSLLTLYAVHRASRGDRSKAWSAAAIAACLAGMACKETMVVTPLLALLYDRLLLSDSWRTLWRTRWPLHAGLLGTCVYLLVPLALPGLARGVHDYEPEGISWGYGAVQLRVIGHYLRLAFWPHPLCLDYGWTTAPESFGGAGSILATLAVAAATLTLLAAGRRSGFLGLCFFLLLAPTSTVFPHTDLAFDHRMYLPLTPLVIAGCLALDGAICRLSRPSSFRPVFAAAVAAMALALGLATARRNGDYADTERMWSAVLAVRPDNIRAAVCLTGDLYARHRDEAVIAIAERILGTPPPAGSAVPVDRRRLVDTSLLLNNLGLALQRQAKPAEAMKALARSVAIAPGNTKAHLNFAAVALAAGETNTALREVDSAYRLSPTDPVAIQAAADLLALTGRPQAAATLYAQILTSGTDYPAVRNRFAWLLATCPDPAVRDGARALHLARQIAAESASLDADAVEILAAAQAETGDTTTAARTQADVIRTFGPTPERRARLDAYLADQAWRDPRMASTPTAVAR